MQKDKENNNDDDSDQDDHSPTPKLANKIIENLKNRKITQQLEMNSYFLKIKFFCDLQEKYGEDVYKQTLKVLKYKKLSKGEVLFNQGQKGSEFYVLLQGVLGVYIRLRPKEDDEEGQEQLKNTGLDYINTKIASIKAGTGFGEIALVDNCRRTATIIADEEDCDLAILDKEYYLKVLGQEYREYLRGKLDFMAKFPFLQHFENNNLKAFSYDFIEQRYVKGDIVCNIGEPCFFMYVVKDGHFEIKGQMQQKIEKDVEYDFQFITYDLKKEQNNLQLQVISAVSDNQFFGEELFVNYFIDKKKNNIKRIFQVQCSSSHALIYKIRVSQILKIIDKNNIQVLKEYITPQYEWRLQKLQERQEIFSNFCSHLDRNKQSVVNQQLSYNELQDSVQVKNQINYEVNRCLDNFSKQKIRRIIRKNIMETQIQTLNSSVEMTFQEQLGDSVLKTEPAQVQVTSPHNIKEAYNEEYKKIQTLSEYTRRSNFLNLRNKFEENNPRKIMYQTELEKLRFSEDRQISSVLNYCKKFQDKYGVGSHQKLRQQLRRFRSIFDLNNQEKINKRFQEQQLEQASNNTNINDKEQQIYQTIQPNFNQLFDSAKSMQNSIQQNQEMTTHAVSSFQNTINSQKQNQNNNGSNRIILSPSSSQIKIHSGRRLKLMLQDEKLQKLLPQKSNSISQTPNQSFNRFQSILYSKKRQFSCESSRASNHNLLEEKQISKRKINFLGKKREYVEFQTIIFIIYSINCDENFILSLNIDFYI